MKLQNVKKVMLYRLVVVAVSQRVLNYKKDDILTEQVMILVGLSIYRVIEL